MDIESLAKERGRNVEAELLAQKKGQDYYFLPGIAEQHEYELEKFLNDTLREDPKNPIPPRQAMANYKQKAQELIRQWSEAAGANPEEELKMFSEAIRDDLGKHWPKHRIRALWTEGLW
jgi:hypothetical protein